MEQIALGTSGRMTTRLGFGCSSLMGATSHAGSLKLLEYAFNVGIRHFDVAPMYGYGEAESCLGEFLERHKNEVTVTTKYGMPPGKNPSWMKLARRLAAPVVKTLPGLKQRLASVASAATHTGERATFTAAQARESLERSLRELRTSRIDVWLLHEVEAENLKDEELLRFLEDQVAQGTIGTFGVGSSGDKVGDLLVQRPTYCRTLQYEWSVLDPVIIAGGPFRIHHRALTATFRDLHAALLADHETCKRWSRSTNIDLASPDKLAHLMLRAALELNPASVILFSSKKPQHMQANVAAAADSRLEAPALELHRLVQAEKHRLFPKK